MDQVDWDQGLTPDVLALVAKMGGLEEMKGMLGTSKTWQEGYELAVISIKLSYTDTMLPAGAAAAQRFPGLTSLAIGASAAPDGWLENLQRFPGLRNLDLGRESGQFMEYQLASRLTDASLEDLRGLPLTSLVLHGGPELRNACLEPLRGMPLVKLLLENCRKLAPEALAPLFGMPISELSLAHSPGLVCDAGLEHLRFLPLTSLNLELGRVSRSYRDRITDAGLSCLEGMPLVTLNLRYATMAGGEGFEHLRRAPLTSLSLAGWHRGLSDVDLELLKGKALTDLDLGYCGWVTDEGLVHLKGLPLQTLSLRQCHRLSNSGLGNFWRMPLTELDLGQCEWLDDGGLSRLTNMPLTSLNLNSCSLITAAGVEPLLKLPLAYLGLFKNNGIPAAVESIISRFVKLLRQSAQL